MLVKLAVWYLLKRKQTVILNTSFDRVFNARVQNDVQTHNNDFIEGTKFKFDNGNEYVFKKE